MEKERKRDESLQLKINYLKMKSALVDRNTGLPSFHICFDDIRSFMEHRRYVGVIHIEISNIYLVESLYGWQSFEKILKKISERLNELRGKVFSEKSILTMNAAYGDKFILFVSETLEGEDITPENLLDLTDKLTDSLSGEFLSEEYATMAARLGFNLGCSILQESPFYRLERLVYQAIEESRNMPLRREEKRISALTSELKNIINAEKIQTVFQNIVDVSNMEVFGYEAFSRGPKDSAFEKPAMMFALSNRMGMSADLDRVCRKVALKNAEGLPAGAKLFINSLPSSIADPDWISGKIDELLWQHGMRAEDIVLEIPEKHYNEDSTSFEKNARFLKGKGMSIAIDDIGTGYSSLQTIMDLNPDYLKIDESLIRDVDKNLIKQELIRSLIQIASNIGAFIIAEGVETDHELDTVKKVGVRYAQGYFFSYPVGSLGTFSKKDLKNH
ncbi:MAG: EAL domain-containing protein [Acidobacteriota bacterium]